MQNPILIKNYIIRLVLFLVRTARDMRGEDTLSSSTALYLEMEFYLLQKTGSVIIAAHKLFLNEELIQLIGPLIKKAISDSVLCHCDLININYSFTLMLTSFSVKLLSAVQFQYIHSICVYIIG